MYLQNLKAPIKDLYVILDPRMYGKNKTKKTGVIHIQDHIVSTVYDLDDENSPIIGLSVNSQYLPINATLDIDIDPEDRNYFLYDTFSGYIVFADEFLALGHLTELLDDDENEYDEN